MARWTEPAVPLAMIVVLTAVLSGGFSPGLWLVLSVLFALVWLLAAAEWTGRPEKTELLFAGLLLWGVVSGVWVRAAPLASKETLTVWIVAWALWIVTRRGSPQSVVIASRFLVCGTVVVAGSVIVTAVSMASVRVGGFFDNPNLAAAILISGLALGLAVLDRRPRLRLWLVIVVIAALVLTGSRAGLLAAVVAAGVLLPRGRIRFLGVLAGTAVAIGAISWRLISQPDLLAWHRPSIWWATLKIWASRPLTGVGPGSLIEAAGAERILHPDQVGRYQFVVGLSESTPLAILVQLGVVGVVLAGLAAGSWWLWARSSGVLESRIFRAGLAGAITLSLFHDVLTTESLLWWWAMVLGCFEVMGRQNGRTTMAVPPLGTRLAAALAMIWLTAWGMAGPSLARWVSPIGEVSTADVERVLRIEPWYAEPAARRVRSLLARHDSWSWETAAEALAWSRYASNVHPGLARRWADLGQVHTRVLTDLGGTGHDMAAARGALERASTLDPHLPWHWLERARLERILGNHHEARGLTRRALQEEPNTVRAWLMLGRLELEEGRMAEAREALDEATRRAELAGRSGLTAYELELLVAPPGQIEFLERTLLTTRAGSP